MGRGSDSPTPSGPPTVRRCMSPLSCKRAIVVEERMEKSIHSMPGALALGKGWLVSLRPTLSTGCVGCSMENFLQGRRGCCDRSVV